MIHLYRDGALIVAVRIDRNNLAWSDKEDRDLHPLAMIELITNTTLFYSRVLDDLQPRPAQLLVGLDLELLHTEQRSVRLPAGGISGHYGFWGPRRDAPAPFWRTALTIDTATYDPARVAFLLVRELYAWFGQSEEDIPYTEGTEDDKRISTDAIQAMG
jgi:hypothetical protein